MYRGLYESVLKNGPISTIILRTDDKKLNEKRMEGSKFTFKRTK